MGFYTEFSERKEVCPSNLSLFRSTELQVSFYVSGRFNPSRRRFAWNSHFCTRKSFFPLCFLSFWYTILGVCSINTFLVLQNFFLMRLYKILNINISKTNRVLRLSLKFNLRAEKEFFKLKKLFLSFRNRLFLMVQKKIFSPRK